jgi:hypothetical protein
MTGRLGQIGHRLGRRSVSAVAVVAAGSLLAAVALATSGVDVAKADTVLRNVRAATVQEPGGASRPGVDGMVVPLGATVTTAPGGSVSLVTAGRVVLLGSDTAVSVYDGSREQLRKGLVMVDARRAGDLRLEAGAATVSAERGSIARIERGALLRTATFRGDVSVRAAGRRATVDVDALKQVQVPYGAVPGRVTALALTHDTWEQRYASGLVASDDDLNKIAKSLDSNGATRAVVAAAVPASYRPSAPLAGESASEQTLGYLVSRAARNGGEKTFGQVRGYREEGGSWGVVAALVGADVARVSSALDALLAPAEDVLAVGAGPANGPVDVGGVLGTAPRPTTGPRPRPTGAPTPTGNPSASPSSSPNPVNDVVTVVSSLLPTPPPTLVPLPSVSPLRLPLVSSPAPLPVPQLQVGGVTLDVDDAATAAATTVAGTTSGLSSTVTGTTSGLTSTVTGVTRGLTGGL